MTNTPKDIIQFISSWIAEQKSLEAPVELTNEANLISMGYLDSLDFLNLVGELESEYSIEIEFEDVDPEVFTTVAGLVRVVLNSVKGSRKD